MRVLAVYVLVYIVDPQSYDSSNNKKITYIATQGVTLPYTITTLASDLARDDNYYSKSTCYCTYYSELPKM